MNLHTAFNYTFNTKLRIRPELLFSHQNTDKEFLLCCHVNYFIEDGEAFGPNEIFWEYQDGSFYANKQSGAFRLENGNTLITDADSALIFEVSIDGDVVWEYQGSGSQINRAQKYSVNYLSIAGDVNSDNSINVIDVVELVTIILASEYIISADMNNDGVNNIADIILLVSLILGRGSNG